MELIIGLIIVVIVLYFLFAGRGRKSLESESVPPEKDRVVPRSFAQYPTKTTTQISMPSSAEERMLNTNMNWLKERWVLARKERDAGEFKIVPHWFFDDVTDRQLQKIEEIGLQIRGNSPTKGEASDIIGLFEPIEEENEEILRFFKVPLKGMNQSRARHEVAKLLLDPQNLASWKARPASLMQKEFYRYFNLKVPQSLTHEEASKFISDYRAKLTNEDEKKLDEWAAYESIYDEITDPGFREDYEIKKISLTLYRSAIEELQKQGKNLMELDDDIDMVVKKIIELKPEIQKE